MAASPRFLTALVVAIVASLGAGCAGFDVEQVDDPVARPAPTPAPPTDEFLLGPGSEVPLEDAFDVRGPQPDPLPGPGSWIVNSTGATMSVWSDPGSDASIRFAVETTNPWGQPIVYPVLHARQSDGAVWYRVQLGIEPNGSSGWVRASDVSLARGTDRIVVDLSRRVLRHLRNGRLIHRFSVGIGASSTPTTPGRFFVWARLQPADAGGAYGSYLLGLSGFSEVLTEWPGGGRMAVHGTSDPTDRGQQVSFGCIRVYNHQMDMLRDVPMGTTVVIKP